MELIIHCGLHKTATTSFQEICASNRALLAEVGIHYPSYKNRDQHSFVLWDGSTDGWHVVEEFLKNAFIAAEGKCHSVLLSGEDFENAIVDLALARDIENAAAGAGFSHVRWVVVTRDPLDYARSLYGEKCKHGVVLHYPTIISIAKTRGVFYLSTANYNYIFVLDFQRFSARFRGCVTGTVTELKMEEFIDGFAGSALLRGILSPAGFTRFTTEAQGINSKPRNQRMSPRQIEYAYAANALAPTLQLTSGRLAPVKRALAWPLWPLMRVRLAIRRKVDDEVGNRPARPESDIRPSTAADPH
jgi:hypothetical protein